MLKLYSKLITIDDSRTNETINRYYKNLVICEEEEAISVCEGLTWDTLWKVDRELKDYFDIRDIYYHDVKNGKMVAFFDINYNMKKKCRKSWKEDLDLELIVEYSEFKGSLQEVLDYYDYRKVIEYLKQEGISLNV